MGYRSFLLHTFFSLFLLFSLGSTVYAKETTWKVQAIDTMKYSRDRARNHTAVEQADYLMNIIQQTGATHVSIATPYNDEFYNTLNTWVSSARAHHLNVWFRGNWAEWEGWFGYHSFSDINEHHIKTDAFIRSHPDLFQDGDIFTPVPEAENGGPGDPRGSSEKAVQFNAFLVKSYNTCTNAMKSIKKEVECGYFSMNGDIARDIMTKDTVQKTGNRIVIDHYVKDTEAFGKDIDELWDKFSAPIVLGEFGAPIPDLNGSLSEEEQAEYVGRLLDEMYRRRDKVVGVNYWTLIDSSTELMNREGKIKKVMDILTSYYMPPMVQGTITDEFRSNLSGVTVFVQKNPIKSVTDTQGTYTAILPPYARVSIQYEKERYLPLSTFIEGEPGKTYTVDHQMHTQSKTLLFYMKLIPLWLRDTLFGV